MIEDSKVGLLVANFGGPERLEDVESFLFNLFNDPAVIKPVLGRTFQRWLAGLISRRRAPKTAAQYQRIGGRSPLVPVTLEQVDALKRQLADLQLPIYVAMRYTPPFSDEAVAQLKRDGIGRLIVLALYPHFSLTTAGSSFEALSEAMARGGLDIPVHIIPAWYPEPGYRAAMVDLIRKKLEGFPDPSRVHLLFSAHGLPSSYVRAGDPYQRQVQESVRMIVDDLGWAGRCSLAWQSKVGPVRWLGPSTEQELDRLAAEGVTDVLVVPVSFVSDHIETLYEIDQLFADHAAKVGIRDFRRTDALNTHPRFIEALAAVVRRALQENGRRRCVRCLLPREPAHFAQKTCVDCHFRIPDYQRWEQDDGL